jgi:hypothetical protein
MIAPSHEKLNTALKRKAVDQNNEHSLILASTVRSGTHRDPYFRVHPKKFPPESLR